LNLMPFFVAATITLCATPAFGQDDDGGARAGAESILAQFMRTWSANDAKGLAALFAPSADFINPYGDLARGPDEIAAFYAGAFARGYAGTKGEGELVWVRLLAPGLALIDGRWRIGGHKNQDGSLRPDERGILVAVISRTPAGWRILALRENASATEIKAIGAGQ
jgi:uncharacterized protein (TIGR02246 family)